MPDDPWICTNGGEHKWSEDGDAEEDEAYCLRCGRDYYDLPDHELHPAPPRADD